MVNVDYVVPDKAGYYNVYPSRVEGPFAAPAKADVVAWSNRLFRMHVEFDGAPFAAISAESLFPLLPGKRFGFSVTVKH